MQHAPPTFQEVRLWFADHRVYVFSAANALIVLLLTCLVALVLEVSATKATYADARDQARVRSTPVPAEDAASGVDRQPSVREAEARAAGALRALAPRSRRVEIRERRVGSQGPPPVWNDEDPSGRMAGPPSEVEPEPDGSEHPRLE